MKKFLIAFFFVVCNISQQALAHSDDFHLNKLNYCRVSKITINDYEPEKFENTNNMLRKTGEEQIYCGEKIIVRGVLLDQNCVPISDAKIYAWQAGCNGKYPYKPLRNRIDEKLIDQESDMSFTGNGVATTNNKGEFFFITTYPPAMHKQSSHINVRAEHFRLGSLQTSLFLRGAKVKNPELDPELISVSGYAKKNGVSIYDFRIVMPGESLNSY